MVRTTPEILKFGIYLLFPVATLFLFNRPEYLTILKQPAIDEIRENIEREKRTLNVGLPTDFEEIEKRLKD